jgi:hypothetical protein
MNEMIEAPYEMANLFPKHTGLPFVVWISARGGARHDIRVKVSASGKAIPGEMATVGIRPEVSVIEGKLDTDAFDLLKTWIELNRTMLISCWEGDIDTQDALGVLLMERNDSQSQSKAADEVICQLVTNAVLNTAENCTKIAEEVCREYMQLAMLKGSAQNEYLICTANGAQKASNAIRRRMLGIF